MPPHLIGIEQWILEATLVVLLLFGAARIIIEELSLFRRSAKHDLRSGYRLDRERRVEDENNAS